MALSFEDEMVAFLRHNLEQIPGWQKLTSGQAHLLTPEDITYANGRRPQPSLSAGSAGERQAPCRHRNR